MSESTGGSSNNSKLEISTNFHSTTYQPFDKKEESEEIEA